MVQLAASRSRALARGVYSRLQGNYSDLLGRRNPLILRVDLGDKGIFYRVNVPGFANRNSADVFCANLKTGAGLPCPQTALIAGRLFSALPESKCRMPKALSFMTQDLGALSSLPATLAMAHN